MADGDRLADGRWYPALRRGGVARIGQLQLIQPFLTLGSSVLLLGETLGATDWLVAAGVVACVAIAQRTRDRVPVASGPMPVDATPTRS